MELQWNFNSQFMQIWSTKVRTLTGKKVKLETKTSGIITLMNLKQGLLQAYRSGPFLPVKNEHSTSAWRQNEIAQSCPTLYDPMESSLHQAPPYMGFSRQEYWSGLPFPSPGNLPNPGIKPRSPASIDRRFTICSTREVQHLAIQLAGHLAPLPQLTTRPINTVKSNITEQVLNLLGKENDCVPEKLQNLES